MIDFESRKIINQLQGGFPISARPFFELEKQLDISENVLIDKIKLLLDNKILTRFGPMFDAQKLGGNFTLAALTVEKGRFDEVANIVNRFPQVAHNYERRHKLNMWFVIASDSLQDIQNTLDKIAKKTNLKVHNFPKICEFYIGLYLELDDENQVKTKSIITKYNLNSYKIDKLDKAIITRIQSGLPLTQNPYDGIAKKINSNEQTVMKKIQKMLASGIIRRIGIVPNHYKLGLKYNGMSVWNVDDTKIKQLGAKIGKLDFVSHSYERPRHLPNWQYNLFAMVHGMNKNEALDKVKTIKKILGKSCKQYDVLFSSRILKKTGMYLGI